MTLDAVQEGARQQAVDRSRAGELRGDRELAWITDQAASKYGTAAAAVSIITGNRQLLISRTGLDVDETARDAAFCAVAIHRPGEPLVVTDAMSDPRFHNHPAVVAPPHIRFYAGMPIVTRDGYALGALCVADPRPCTTTIDPTELMILARQAERLFWR